MLDVVELRNKSGSDFTVGDAAGELSDITTAAIEGIYESATAGNSIGI